MEKTGFHCSGQGFGRRFFPQRDAGFSHGGRAGPCSGAGRAGYRQDPDSDGTDPASGRTGSGFWAHAGCDIHTQGRPRTEGTPGKDLPETSAPDRYAACVGVGILDGSPGRVSYSSFRGKQSQNFRRGQSRLAGQNPENGLERTFSGQGKRTAHPQ